MTSLQRDFAGASPQLRLEGFKNAVISPSKVEFLNEGAMTGRYTNHNGQVIERDFAGPARINRQPVDLAQWPLTVSKWAKQLTRDAPLEMTDGHRKRTYHLDTWTITESKGEPDEGEQSGSRTDSK